MPTVNSLTSLSLLRLTCQRSSKRSTTFRTSTASMTCTLTPLAPRKILTRSTVAKHWSLRMLAMARIAAQRNPKENRYKGSTMRMEARRCKTRILSLSRKSQSLSSKTKSNYGCRALTWESKTSVCLR